VHHLKEVSILFLKKLTPNAVAIQIPIGIEEKILRLIDLMTMKALRFEGDFGQIIKEEEIAELRRMALWKRAPAEVYEYLGMEEEPERFSFDLDWMPRLVLMAKNVYVWLHQLSRKYQRSIYRLDQIPDEELDLLARWGFTGLWLIGIWERSLASKRIKEILGGIQKKDLQRLLSELMLDYDRSARGFTLVEVAEGFQFRTRPEYAEWIKKLKKTKPLALSQPGLETLAIIAYKQPIVRGEVEKIRGVDSGGVLRTLLERKLIRILGKKDVPGKPLVYGTSKQFLEMFGLNLEPLPRGTGFEFVDEIVDEILDSTKPAKGMQIKGMQIKGEQMTLPITREQALKLLEQYNKDKPDLFIFLKARQSWARLQGDWASQKTTGKCSDCSTTLTGA
jgi:segregation and condensation protein B